MIKRFCTINWRKKGKWALVSALSGIFIISLTSFGQSISTKIDVFYNNIKIVVDGVEKTPDNDMKPFVYNGRAYVSLRFVGEAIGKEVEWDGNNNTAFIGERTQTGIKYSRDNKDCILEGRGKIKLKDNKEETLFVTKEYLTDEYIKTSGMQSGDNPVRIKLKINSAEAVFESFWSNEIKVSIADFDKADNDLDIYITMYGGDIMAETYIYKYNGKTIYQYASFKPTFGEFYYDENGKIYFNVSNGGETVEINHFYDYKTKQSGGITDLSLKRKLNEQSLLN